VRSKAALLLALVAKRRGPAMLGVLLPQLLGAAGESATHTEMVCPLPGCPCILPAKVVHLAASGLLSPPGHIAVMHLWQEKRVCMASDAWVLHKFLYQCRMSVAGEGMRMV
jgi:hypothetical protein